eukprot:3816385-Rhodomonas_salina.1
MVLDVKPKQCDRLIAMGIRAAITEARQVCTARHELAKEVPKSFGPYGRLQYTAKCRTRPRSSCRCPESSLVEH